MPRNSSPAPIVAESTPIVAPAAATIDTAPPATPTDDLVAALAKIKDLESTIASMKTAPSAVDTLTALFKGDKAVHAAALTALVRLAHEKDATGASYPEVTREAAGQLVTVGLWRGIVRTVKGQYNVESKAFAVGRDIAGKARKAAIKGSDKAEEAALTETRNLLNLGNTLPDLIHGLRNQYNADRAADNAIKPFNGIDKGSANLKADKRLTKIEGESAGA